MFIKALDPDSCEMLVPDPVSVNPDPQHCLTLYLVLFVVERFAHHTLRYHTDPALNGRVVLGQKHSFRAFLKFIT